jgi:hypothetical protein
LEIVCCFQFFAFNFQQTVSPPPEVVKTIPAENGFSVEKHTKIPVFNVYFLHFPNDVGTPLLGPKQNQGLGGTLVLSYKMWTFMDPSKIYRHSPGGVVGACNGSGR